MRSRLNKIFLSIFVLLAVIMSGCQTQSRGAQDEDYLYFLFATPLRNHVIWLQAKEGFEQACMDLGIKYDWLGPDVIDTEAMEKVMQTGFLQDVDAIITQGVVSDEVVNLAWDLGIPVFLVDSDMPDSDRICYMGKDFREQAELLLDHIEERVDPDTELRIAIQVAESGFTIAQEQIRQIEEVFAQHPGGVEIVSVSDSKSEEARARKEWDAVIQEHPDINVAINFAAESAEFCWDAVNDSGLRDDVLIYGVDDMPVNLELVREGKVDGIVATSFYQYGYHSVELLYDYLVNGNIPPEQEKTDLQIVDRSNVETYREDEHESR